MARGSPCRERSLWDTGRPPRVSSLTQVQRGSAWADRPSPASRGTIDKYIVLSSTGADTEDLWEPPCEAPPSPETESQEPPQEATCNLAATDSVAEAESHSNLADETVVSGTQRQKEQIEAPEPEGQDKSKVQHYIQQREGFQATIDWMQSVRKLPVSSNGNEVAVVLGGFPRALMTKSQAEKLESKILERIKLTEPREPVAFISSRYEKGAIIFTCPNEISKKWLKETVPQFETWLNYELEVGPSDIVFHGVKFAIWVPKKDTEIIFNLIEKRNRGVSTSQWTVTQRKYVKDTRTKLEVWIDNHSFNILKAHKLRLTFRRGRITFRPVLKLHLIKKLCGLYLFHMEHGGDPVLQGNGPVKLGATKLAVVKPSQPAVGEDRCEYFDISRARETRLNDLEIIHSRPLLFGELELSHSLQSTFGAVGSAISRESKFQNSSFSTFRDTGLEDLVRTSSLERTLRDPRYDHFHERRLRDSDHNSSREERFKVKKHSRSLERRLGVSDHHHSHKTWLRDKDRVSSHERRLQDLDRSRERRLRYPDRSHSSERRLRDPDRSRSRELRLRDPDRSRSRERRLRDPDRSRSSERRLRDPDCSRSHEQRLLDANRSHFYERRLRDRSCSRERTVRDPIHLPERRLREADHSHSHEGRLRDPGRSHPHVARLQDPVHSDQQRLRDPHSVNSHERRFGGSDYAHTHKRREDIDISHSIATKFRDMKAIHPSATQEAAHTHAAGFRHSDTFSSLATGVGGLGQVISSELGSTNTSLPPNHAKGLQDFNLSNFLGIGVENPELSASCASGLGNQDLRSLTYLLGLKKGSGNLELARLRTGGFGDSELIRLLSLGLKDAEPGYLCPGDSKLTRSGEYVSDVDLLRARSHALLVAPQTLAAGAVGYDPSQTHPAQIGGRALTLGLKDAEPGHLCPGDSKLTRSGEYVSDVDLLRARSHALLVAPQTPAAGAVGYDPSQTHPAQIGGRALTHSQVAGFVGLDKTLPHETQFVGSDVDHSQKPVFGEPVPSRVEGYGDLGVDRLQESAYFHSGPELSSGSGTGFSGTDFYRRRQSSGVNETHFGTGRLPGLENVRPYETALANETRFMWSSGQRKRRERN